MPKKALGIFILSCLVFCWIIPCIFSQEGTEDVERKIKEVKQEKVNITRDYEKELTKLNNEYDAKLRVIKNEFHNKRDTCLREKAGKQNGLEKAYEEKLKPLLDEERRLLAALGPGKGMNFAYPKSEREK